MITCHTLFSCKYKKGYDCSYPYIKILSHNDACHPLFYSNFLHATIAILHNVQSLGWTYQSLTIYRIARYFLNISRGCSLVDTCCIEFYYVLKVAKAREPVIIISSLRYIKCTFSGSTTFECITTYSWYFLCIYIYTR